MREVLPLIGWVVVLLGGTGLPPWTSAAAEPAGPTARFLGEQTCRSAGCHGGGEGKNQCLTWEKKDAHARAHAILANARSQRIAEALGMGEAAKAARCTVCHSPLQAVPESRLAAGLKPEPGVSCETCHGPAEPWLRFHTRADLTREQRLSAGLRDLRGPYHRANACIACHLNVEPALLQAGHPELTFELAGRLQNEPPHWRAEPDAWTQLRAWQTGQAASLRELSWQAAATGDAQVQARARGLLWLLRQSTLGAQLPENGEARATQAAADRLARTAGDATWSRAAALAQLRRLAETSEAFRSEAVPAAEHRRRAEFLVLGVDRCWQALKAAGAASPTLDTALGVALGEARAQGGFQPARFAAALQQVEVAVVQLPASAKE